MTTSNNLDSKEKIIGIGGLPRSGKDTLAELFIENGYFGVSLGDIVRDQAKVRHGDQPDPISVANMTETANWLREENGADFALKQALGRFALAKESKDYKGLVVFSVRAPAEVDFILQNKGQLIWVESADETRLERMNQHLRQGEVPLTLSQFKAQEDLQAQPQPGWPPEAQMNTTYVRQKATATIENNFASVEQFKNAAQKLIEVIEHASRT